MFSTSHDILLLTIAICIAAFTVFLCWGMFYLVAMTRNAFKIFKDVRRIFDKVEGAVDAVREKIDSSASYMSLIGEGIKKIVEIAKVWHEKQECECDDDDECTCQESTAEEVKEEKAKKVKVKEK